MTDAMTILTEERLSDLGNARTLVGLHKDSLRYVPAWGWSPVELARRAGLNATTLSLIEPGRFQPYPRLRKLADALGVSSGEAERLLLDWKLVEGVRP